MGVYANEVLPRLQDRVMNRQGPREARSRICAGLTGQVVEVGFGTGLNARYYPQEVTKVFEKTKKSVPVFNDKHLAATWEDAKWMYDRSRELFVPFLAGSSVPVTWRRPPLQLPKNCELVEAVQIGYGPFEGYGFHALEGLQCMVERRKGGETGVRAVQCVQGITATNHGPMMVERGLAIATALAPEIGYDAAAQIAKEAAKRGASVREIALEQKVLPPEKLDEVLNPEEMTKPGHTAGSAGG